MAERQFGPYRLVRQIAVGGMAEIHLAKTAGIAWFQVKVGSLRDLNVDPEYFRLFNYNAKSESKDDE